MYPSGKEEQPWPLSEAKSIVNQSLSDIIAIIDTAIAKLRINQNEIVHHRCNKH